MDLVQTVRVREVATRADRRAFVRLPWKLNAGRPRWVPPLLADEHRFLDPRHPARSYCDATFALAVAGTAVVGRIAGIVNRRYNEKTGTPTARFSVLECTDDPSVASALLGHVERWASSLGTVRIVGPMGFTDQDPEGFLIEGFEHEPTLATYYNPEYLPRLLEACGYQKEVDYVTYRASVPSELPPLYQAVLRRAAGRGRFRLVEFRRRRELKPYVEPVLKLTGEAYEDIYGFVAPDPAERRALARQYMPLLDPRFLKVAEKDGAVVGFVIGMPNITPGLRAANGRLFPFGLIRILRAARRSRQLDLLLGGIRADCRGRGVDVLLGAAMLRSAHGAGLTVLDSHHELETNTAMRAEMERVGGTIYKRHRIYGKTLGG